MCKKGFISAGISCSGCDGTVDEPNGKFPLAEKDEEGRIINVWCSSCAKEMLEQAQ